MPEEKIVQDTPVEEPTEDLSNHDVKLHPRFLAVTKQLGEYQRLETERKETEANAARESEIKKAEGEKRYEDALAMRDKEFADFKTKTEAETQKRDLESALYQAGFGHKLFIGGAMGSYDAKSHGTYAEYAATLAADEANSGFLNQTPARTVHQPPAKAPSPGTGKVSWDQVAIDKLSPDPVVRAEARAKDLAYFKENGKWPY